MAGWKILTRLKDQSEMWVPLSQLKESSLVQVALFASSRGIDNEPAFSWWVPYTLKKVDLIICQIKARMKVTTHKYDIEIPRSIKDAKRLNEKNGNTLWMDVLAKEMMNVSVAFNILLKGESAPAGYKKASGHLVWDLKMDFTRKAWRVKDGHRTPDPAGSNFASFVSKENVHIAFTYAALNDLDVYCADIQNTYLVAPTSEKHYNIICGDEFGEQYNGCVAVITRALYGGKKVGRDYWMHMQKFIQSIEFTLCKADPDVWMRSAVDEEGESYWEYILLYTDNVLCISHKKPVNVLAEIGRHFKLKNKSI